MTLYFPPVLQSCHVVGISERNDAVPCTERNYTMCFATTPDLDGQTHVTAKSQHAYILLHVVM